jgi:hypothetical protein
MEIFDKNPIIEYCRTMRGGIPGFLITLGVILAVSCASAPKPEEIQVEEPAVNTTAVRQDDFDPSKVTQEQYSSTMDEVQHFIEELNRVIRSRNYNAWRAALSPDYFAVLSSPENLQEISEQPAMKTRRIVLRSAQDYFTHVVVPSRANSRVDGIEFIGRSRVKAFTINTNRAGEEQRLLLYSLEKIGDSWKIIN